MKEIESLKDLTSYLNGKKSVNQVAVQAVDLTSITKVMSAIEFKSCLFLGCRMTDDMTNLLSAHNYIFPRLDVPFDIYRSALYDAKALYNNYDYKTPKTYQGTYDKVVYDHYIEKGKEADYIDETLARWLHDHSITDATYDFLSQYEERRVIAIMGGHGLSRASENYTKVALISKKLSELDYLMISGGGPGAMEATHVGSWFAGKSISEMKEAIEILKEAPKYNHKMWLPTAFRVMEQYPSGPYKSLGIPTWLYGHEPPTPFATHIAKYFANSVREEGLLAVAKGGVVFAPGSAGTMQEIFQELAQNHYESYGAASPMVFMDSEYWTNDRPVYPVIKSMKENKALNNLNIGLYDDIDLIIDHLVHKNDE